MELAKLKRLRNAWKKKRKEKFQVSFLSLEEEKNPYRFSILLLFLPFSFHENFPPHERRTGKLNRFESIPTSLFSRKVSSTMPDMSKGNTLDISPSLRNLPSTASRGGCCSLTSPRSFRTRILFPILFHKVYFLFFFYSLSLITSRSKCFSQERRNISRGGTSVFDTDVTALRVAAHILTVTEFSAVSDLRRF